MKEDTRLLTFIEHTNAQLWHNKNGSWTIFIVRPKPLYPIQPTKPTLREALKAALIEWEAWQALGVTVTSTTIETIPEATPSDKAPWWADK